jgi:hypothetical protein
MGVRAESPACRESTGHARQERVRRRRFETVGVRDTLAPIFSPRNRRQEKISPDNVSRLLLCSSSTAKGHGVEEGRHGAEEGHCVHEENGVSEANGSVHEARRIDWRVDGCLVPGRVAGLSASPCVERPTAGRRTEGLATAGQSRRPAVAVASADDRHFLHPGNDCYVLQRARRSEHQRLRIWLRNRIDRRIRLERWVGGKRRRARQRVISPAVHARTGGERTLLLTGQTAHACGSD